MQAADVRVRSNGAYGLELSPELTHVSLDVAMTATPPVSRLREGRLEPNETRPSLRGTPFVFVKNVALVSHAEQEPQGLGDPAAIARRIMLRRGVTPVPVAIINDGAALSSARVKKPWGPEHGNTVPGLTSCSHVDPGPPCTRVTAISNLADPSGADAIEYERFIVASPVSDGIGSSRFTHCPGSKIIGVPSTRSNTARALLVSEGARAPIEPGKPAAGACLR